LRAFRPSSVFMPVATTTPSLRPAAAANIQWHGGRRTIDETLASPA
jgi:hypothetical protein